MPRRRSCGPRGTLRSPAEDPASCGRSCMQGRGSSPCDGTAWAGARTGPWPPPDRASPSQRLTVNSERHAWTPPVCDELPMDRATAFTGWPQGHLVPTIYTCYVPLARKRAVGVALLFPAATGLDALLHPCVGVRLRAPSARTGRRRAAARAWGGDGGSRRVGQGGRMPWCGLTWEEKLLCVKGRQELGEPLENLGARQCGWERSRWRESANTGHPPPRSSCPIVVCIFIDVKFT